MTSTQVTVWLLSRNMSADAKGSIHDEERAKALGFKAALIGGSVHSAFVTKAAVERFGQAWYERGFFKQTYIAPLYEGDEFRIVMDALAPTAHDEVLVELAFETRAGLRTTAGYAGLARDAATALPPWKRPGEPPAAGPVDADPLPTLPVGTVFPPHTRVVQVEESANRRGVAGDTSTWYTSGSPWGGPIVPTFMYMLLGLGQQSGPAAPELATEAARAGMNGTFQLLQTGPMFAGEPYTVQSTLVEKGYGGSTAFRTNEFSMADAQGRRVALARQKVRWFARPA